MRFYKSLDLKVVIKFNNNLRRLPRTLGIHADWPENCTCKLYPDAGGGVHVSKGGVHLSRALILLEIE